MSRATKIDIENWKYLAIDVLRSKGALLPADLASRTGVTTCTAIMRARKFDKTFRVATGTSKNHMPVATAISLCQGL